MGVAAKMPEWLVRDVSIAPDMEKEFPFMRRSIFAFAPLAAAFVSVCFFLGCNSSTEKKEPSQEEQSTETGDKTAQSNAPARAAYRFLEAMRTGNDKAATAMFTTLARENIHKLGGQAALPSSDTARFEIGEVQMLADDGARVPCIWTDLDAKGQEKSYRMLWMLRKEKEGWRVAGMATEVFKGEPALVLNFEKPEEVLEKKQMLEQERQRREAVKSAPQGRTALQPQTPEGGQPVRR